MRVVNIIHDPSWTESRVSDVLRARGHTVTDHCPAVGDPLPPIGEADAVVVNGGPVSVWQADELPFVRAEIDLAARAVEEGIPYLGLCLGGQVLAAAFGATTVERVDGMCEFGFHPIEATEAGRTLFPEPTTVFQSHYEGLASLPPDAVHLARSDRFEYQAFALGPRALGLQFHPDARLDMLAGWWEGNTLTRNRPGAQSRRQLLALGAQSEPAWAAWVGHLVDHWLGADPDPDSDPHPDPDSGPAAADGPGARTPLTPGAPR